MSNTSSNHSGGEPNREQLLSALFANLVLQQANLAQMFLGKVPYPETGKTVVDLEAAQLFIDNLEMLELKSRGNLNKHEENLLKQSLMSARMAFVEVANKPPPPAPAGEPKTASTPASGDAAPAQPATAAPGAAGEKPGDDSDADERRKFVKKY